MKKLEEKIEDCWTKFKKYSLVLVTAIPLALGAVSSNKVYAQNIKQEVKTSSIHTDAVDALLFNLAVYGLIIKDLVLRKSGMRELPVYDSSGYLRADNSISPFLTIKTVKVDDVKTLKEIGNKNIDYFEELYKDQMKVYIKNPEELKDDLTEARIHEMDPYREFGSRGWNRISIPQELARWKAFTENADTVFDDTQESYMRYTKDYVEELKNIQQFNRAYLKRLNSLEGAFEQEEYQARQFQRLESKNVPTQLDQGGILLDKDNTYLIDEKGNLKEIEESILKGHKEKGEISWRFEHKDQEYQAVALPFTKEQPTKKSRHYYNSQQDIMICREDDNIIAIKYIQNNDLFQIIQVAKGKVIGEKSKYPIFKIDRVLMTDYPLKAPSETNSANKINSNKKFSKQKK